MSSIFDGIGDDGVEQLDENLRKWFKEKWVRFGPDGKIRGACARGDDSEGKPKCLPQKKAHALGKKGRKYAASKKRREDPNPERRGKAKNVATKKKTNEGMAEALVHRSYVGSSEPIWNIRDSSRRLRHRRDEVIIANATPRNEKESKYSYTRDKEYRKQNSWFVGQHSTYIDGKLAQKIPDNAGPGRQIRYDYNSFSKFSYADTKEPFVKADFVHFTPEKTLIAYDVPGPAQASGPNVTVSAEQPNMKDQNMNEEKCPECGGPMYHESMMNEKQDACYHKVKSRYKVWPSAYASGALVQCRKKGASNWGNGGKKNESNIMKGLVAENEMVHVIYVDGHPLVKYVDKTRANTDAERVRKKFPKKNVEVKHEMHEASSPAQQAAIAINMKKRGEKPKNEGVIVGHDKDDPDVAVLGGAGTYKLSNLKKKAQMEANELAKDVNDGKFKNSAYNVKQLANTLNTVAAAEEEMEKLYFGEDSSMEFPAEVTPAINPYGGLEDRKFRGAIGEALLSEMPTDNPTGASGEGGWRTYRPKPAGEIDEDTAYAGGMGQGGNAGQSYRKFKPKSAGTFEGKESPYQDGYKAWKAYLNGETKQRPSNPYPAGHGMGEWEKGAADASDHIDWKAGTRDYGDEELDEACWKGYHKEGNKKMFGKTYPNCVKNTNEEELEEGLGTSIKQAALGLGGAAALAASPVQARASDVQTTPSVTQQAQPTVYKEKLHPTGKAAKKYGLSDLYNDIFSPGQDEETLLKNIKKIHDGRPPELGEKVGSLELIPSDRNDADYIARVNYQNGRLDIYMQKGGMLRSALVPFIDKTPTGKKKKYIMLWANWTVGTPQEKRAMDFESTQLDEKCWDTHKQVGMKNKGGKQVPNCVPKESAIMKGLTGKRR